MIYGKSVCLEDLNILDRKVFKSSNVESVISLENYVQKKLKNYLKKEENKFFVLMSRFSSNHRIR